MKKFFKILGKTILYLIIRILAVLGIFLIIVCSDNGFRICFNNNSDKYCYNFKINMNEKIYENDGKVIERNYINGIENGSIIYYYTSGNIGIKGYYENGDIEKVINYDNLEGDISD